MLTIKHAFNSKIQSVTLVRALGSHFCSPLISNNLLFGCVMVREWAINELFPCLPKFSPKWSVWVCLPGELSKRRKDALPKNANTSLSLYIYIQINTYIQYILHITHFSWTTWLNGSVKWIKVSPYKIK